MEFLLKASIVLVVFYLCYQLFFKNDTFFNHNRWFLFIGLVLACVFPLIVIPIEIPIEPLQQQSNSSVFVPLNSIEQAPIQTLQETPFNWMKFWSIIYVTGVVLVFIKFIVEIVSLLLLLFKHKHIKMGDFIYVILNKSMPPFSFFKWIAFNPKTFKEEELQLILNHEKVHAKEWHSLDVILAQLACIVFWFNPLVWLYRKSVQQNLEYIADSKSHSVSNQKNYQHLLLKTSVNTNNIVLSNHFNHSSIKKRIVMLQQQKSSKIKLWKFLILLPILTLLLLNMNIEEVYVEKETSAFIPLNMHENGVANSTNNSTFVFQKEKKETVEITFNKNTTQAQLKSIKKQLKAKGVTLTINNIERNDKGEITAIDLKFEGNDSKANYNVSGSGGIRPFQFKMTDNYFGVGNFSDEEVKETFIVKQPKKAKTHTTSEVFVYSSDGKIKDTVRYEFKNGQSNNYVFYSADTLVVKSNDSTKTEWIIKKPNTFYFQNNGSRNGQNIEETIEIIEPNVIKRNFKKGAKPLVIVNGEVIKNEDIIYDIDSDNINNVTVLKDKAAIKMYGNKAKNGVVIVELNDKDSNTKNYTYEVISKYSNTKRISKNTTNTQLKTYKEDLAKEGINAKFTKVRRNKNGEITSIKIALNDNKGRKTSTSYKKSDGIDDIEIGISDNQLNIRTIN